MLYPLTERQTRFVAIAQDLAYRFSRRAARYDREGSFPVENVEDIRNSGLPALVVPERYGGWGGNLLETVLAMETLAVGDGSTALSTTMHMQTLAGAVEKRSWPADLLAEICRAVVERGALLNAIASEPRLGSPSRGGRPQTTARPVFDRRDGDRGAGNSGEPAAWILNGRKNFASLSPALDYMLILAYLEDGSDRNAYFFVEPGAGVEIIETWDAMGMRSTGSHDVLLEDVRVPARYLIPPKPDDSPKISAWFPLTVSAVYLGVAVAALQAAAHYAQERMPTALGKPIAELESIQRRLGQAELLIAQARTHLYHAAELWDRCPEQREKMRETIIVAKYTATNNAIDAVDHAMRVVGGASMSRRLPLERFYRDVRGGLSHPMNDDQALVTLGQLALDRYRIESNASGQIS